MTQDAEAEMIGFYLLRGHTLDELLSLSTSDRIFYAAAMLRYKEELDEIAEAVRR